MPFLVCSVGVEHVIVRKQKQVCKFGKRVESSGVERKEDERGKHCMYLLRKLGCLFFFPIPLQTWYGMVWYGVWMVRTGFRRSISTRERIMKYRREKEENNNR